MERLFIKLQDGQPIKHPIVASNMVSAYPRVSLDVLPTSEWAEFISVPQPKLGVYETVSCTYDWDEDVVKHVWTIHPMTDEEKSLKQETVKMNWNLDGGAQDWIFDEETCTHVAPIDIPEDGKDYLWDVETSNWVEAPEPEVTRSLPEYPADGKIYDYDPNAEKWVLRKISSNF